MGNMLSEQNDIMMRGLERRLIEEIKRNISVVENLSDHNDLYETNMKLLRENDELKKENQKLKKRIEEPKPIVLNTIKDDDEEMDGSSFSSSRWKRR